MDDPDRNVQINMSAIPVAGIGGIGMLALAAIIAAVFTEARWLLGVGLAGGVVCALLLIAYHRSHKSPPPTHIA
ncbi:MAG: hypothetical protein ACM36C_04560 [Acidobacteriota bacterium]